MSSVNRGNNGKQSKQSVFTKETLGVVLILFATLCLVCLITRDIIFSLPGKAVNFFLYGLFGYYAIALCVWAITLGILLVCGKKIQLTLKRKILLVTLLFLCALLTHIITMHGANLTYGEYLKTSYLMAEGGILTCSGGGVITAIFAFLLNAILTNIGSYVVLGLLIALCSYFLIADIKKGGKVVRKSSQSASQKFNSSYVNNEEKQIKIDGVVVGETKEYPVNDVNFVNDGQKTQKLFVNNSNDFAFKTKKDIKNDASTPGIKINFNGEGGLGVGSAGRGYTKQYANEMQEKINYIKTPAKIDLDSALKSVNNGRIISGGDYGTRVSSAIPKTPLQEQPTAVQEKPQETSSIPIFEHDASQTVNKDLGAEKRAEEFFNKYASVNEETEIVQEKFVSDEETFRTANVVGFNESIRNQTQNEQTIDEQPIVEIEKEDSSVADQPTPPVLQDRRARRILFGEQQENNNTEQKIVGEEDYVKENSSTVDETPVVDRQTNQNTSSRISSFGERPSFTSRVNADNNGRRGLDFLKEQKEETPEVQPEKPKKEEPPINREYFRPPFDLLETYAPPAEKAMDNHQERMEIIKQTLESFHINAVPQSYVQGPSITRYEIQMPSGISVKKVLPYDDDLKMRLRVVDGVRIEAPIPGKDLVGIEVANSTKVTVGLKEVLEGLAGKKSKPGSLMFAIGKDIVGNPISDNLAKGPHFLVAGATGSGKSVCLNVMIVSLIMRYSPEELRLILIDPKRVEFRIYEHIPHLMIDEIVNEPKKALATLSWAHEEMERRYKRFEECGGMIVDIDSYNEYIASDTVAKMPRIVIIIDELADLMGTCKKDFEARIMALAQKARSAGIHLVLATQRPSVDVITGTIKANLPSRIALKVMNFNDSQTILGEQGAEKLLGNGDMLYKNSGMPGFERYQGAWINPREINSIVSYIKEHNKAYFDDELQEYLDRAVRPKQEESTSSDEEMGQMENENNEFFIKALGLAVNSGTISISMLQRRFQIGYARAGGLVDKMERLGYVSGNEGSKARKVLITREEFEEKFGQIPD